MFVDVADVTGVFSSMCKRLDVNRCGRSGALRGISSDLLSELQEPAGWTMRRRPQAVQDLQHQGQLSGEGFCACTVRAKVKHSTIMDGVRSESYPRPPGAFNAHEQEFYWHVDAPAGFRRPAAGFRSWDALRSAAVCLYSKVRDRTRNRSEASCCYTSE